MLLSLMRWEDQESPPLPKEPDPSDLKLQETFFGLKNGEKSFSS